MVVVDAQQNVELSTDGGIRWIGIQKGQSLRSGDRLRTGPNSRLSIRLPDNSVAEFNENTEIAVSPPQAPGGLRLFRGMMSFFHRGKPGYIRVVTRGAAAGVRGTEFVMEVELVDNVERATLSLIDGIVRFENPQGFLDMTNLQQAVAVEGQAPMLTAGFLVNNVLQWAFYYPAVLNLDELPLAPDEEQALAKSIADYRAGELLAALANYPADRQPASAAERLYYAALLLSVGQAAKAEPILTDILVAADVSPRLTRLATALRHLIAAVKGDSKPSTLNPQLSTEFLAASYYEQSIGRGDESLLKALELARAAANVAPNFAFAWARVAELEFSFGRTRRALDALNRSLELAPRNPQALALKGFLLAAQNKTREAIKYFDQAIAIDAALGNAWLGRGLVRIRQGDLRAGRDDLLIAAANEPRRSVLRSYLGKAYAESDSLSFLGLGTPADPKLAEKEFALAKQLDPNDPTAWLYSALLKEQQNRANEAIDDLERSKELNDNRLLYRSRLLLDQDQAIRSANLARIYADAGMEEVAVREASRSVASDYANSSAHLFLANSYDLLRQANYFDLRFETPATSEFLLASLMGPPDGRLLAQPVSQQEYTRLFDSQRFGLSSRTDYLSHGDWAQYVAQYGTLGNSSYALEGFYRSGPGESAYQDWEARFFGVTFKQMLTPKDGLLVRVLDSWQEFGDLGQRYDPNQAIAGLRTREKQEPSLLAGLDHQWNEANRTLFLASRFNSDLLHANPHGPTFLVTEFLGTVDGLFRTDLTQEYRNRLSVDSFELQHLVHNAWLQTIAGVRFQHVINRVSNLQVINVLNSPGLESYFGNPGTVITNQSLRTESVRISPYFYQHLRIAEPLWLIGGFSYDYQEKPENVLFAPVDEEVETERRVSPKGALVWTPTPNSTIRAAYTRSLGGISLDQSVRMEPTQLAGFVQSYRSVMPASLVGGVSGAQFETADLSIEHQFETRTYVALSGQLLRSSADHQVGGFQRDVLTGAGPGVQIHEELRYQERSLAASLHQLLGDWFSVAVRYRISDSWLKYDYPDIDPALCMGNCRTDRGLLHFASLNGLFRHQSGFFASAEAQWWRQELDASLSGTPEEDFWQINLFAGYRFPNRHLEITVGVLNVTGQDYRLYPINFYGDLPRERTLAARLLLNF